uniref:Uncharacterized protein n=1 Tax=Physcomitrium patens TaxID=3218 RepID=A0A7I4AV70_PHYPA
MLHAAQLTKEIDAFYGSNVTCH